MATGHYLHPIIVAIFMGLFTIISLISFLNMFKKRRMFPSLLLFLAIVIFGYTTYITATF